MTKSGIKRLGRITGLSLALLTLLLILCAWPHINASPGGGALFALQVDPFGTPDPLDVPEMPENPTQLDIGRIAYYYHCMACHGDHGQGLTEVWRLVWVEDHRDCWNRGCHAGRPGDEGFPIATVVPALYGAPDALADYASPSILHHYLQETHPPQNPGSLPEEDYWALTAFLLDENGWLPSGEELGPSESATPTPPPTATLAPPPTKTPAPTETSSLGTAVAAAPSANTTPEATPPAAYSTTLPSQFLPLAAAVVIAFALAALAAIIGIIRKR